MSETTEEKKGKNTFKKIIKKGFLENERKENPEIELNLIPASGKWRNGAESCYKMYLLQ